MCALSLLVQSQYLDKTRIALSELPAAARDTELLHSQFASLPLGLVRPCKYGRLPQNRAKNRYGNLMPCKPGRFALVDVSWLTCSEGQCQLWRTLVILAGW